MIKKREIEKFPYGTPQGLSEDEAKANFISFCKKYGPVTVRIGFFAIVMSSSSAFASDAPPPGPLPGTPPGQLCPAPSSPKVLPALKELLGIAAVGLICAAASANPVTALGIAACALAIAAKAANKL